MTHQERFAKKWLSSSARGMLEFWSLGSGKSCGAILAVDAHIKAHGQRKVYFISPASIRASFVGEYCSSCGQFPYHFQKIFHFFSYNNTRVLEILPPNLDNSIVIVDECHRLINGKKNQGKVLSGIYDLIFKARNTRVILLSGTPLWSSKYDLALLINLLNPGSVPFDKEQFNNLARNDSYILERLQGLISYVPAIDNPDVYPTSTQEVINVPMSPYQFSVYKTARLKEINSLLMEPDPAMRARDPERYAKIKSQIYIARAMIMSRQRCNFVYPSEIQERIDKDPKSVPSDLTASWITEDDTVLNNLEVYSPKIRQILNRVILLPGKHMIYSLLTNHYGIYLVQKLLEHCKIRCLTFTGDLKGDEERDSVLRKFNAESNKHGEEYRVLLVSSAGAVGITVCSARWCHIMEPDINNLIISQVKGRVKRFLSHAQLPKEERVVTFFDYFATLPTEVTQITNKGKKLMVNAFEELDSSDELTYKLALKKEREILHYIELMKRAAFDCKENYNKDCAQFELGQLVSEDYQEPEFDENGELILREADLVVDEEDYFLEEELDL